MKRTTVFLDEVVECDLKALAQRRGQPVAELVREALTGYVRREKVSTAPALRFLGIGRSGHRDVAKRHEAMVFARLTPHGEPAPPRQGKRGVAGPRGKVPRRDARDRG